MPVCIAGACRVRAIRGSQEGRNNERAKPTIRCLAQSGANTQASHDLMAGVSVLNGLEAKTVAATGLVCLR
jgi:hypothetical protein